MKFLLRYCLAILAVLFVTFKADASNPPHYESGPCFFQNSGQIADVDGEQRNDILFSAEFNGGIVFFSEKSVSYVFQKPFDVGEPGEEQNFDVPIEGHRIDMRWKGISEKLEIFGQNQRKEVRNFYYEHCPSGIMNVPSFDKIIYKNIYENIDAVFYFSESGLKYDYIVHPGGNYENITFSYFGENDFESAADGGMILDYGFGSMKESKPISFQEGEEVGSSMYFYTNGSTSDFGDNVNDPIQYWEEDKNGIQYLIQGDWDKTKDLVIDPSVSWATYYGGSGTEFTMLFGDIASDSDANVYLSGHTNSTNFPVSVGAYQTTNAGGTQDAIVLKFDNTGARVWGTYFGTSGQDVGSGLAIDGHDRLYFTGSTTSPSFPTTSGAFQQTFNSIQDAFIVKMDVGGALLYASYLGGNGTDDGNRVAVDNDNNLIVVGATTSSTFPVGSGAHQATNGGSNDFFVMKFDSTGTRIFGSYYGSIGNDFGQDVAADHNGNVFVTGTVGSSALSQVGNTFQSSYGGGITDASISKWSPTGTMLWSSYYGGSADDSGMGLDCDSDGAVFFGGHTTSGNFPVSSGAYQTSKSNSSFIGFLVKFDELGNREWGTFFGGNTWERIADVNVGVNDEAYLTGDTRSTNCPTTNDAHQATFGGGFNDGLIIKFDGAGSLLYSSFIGGNDQDNGRAVGVGNDGSFFVVGNTKSGNFPVTGGAQQSTYGGNTDGFIYSFYDCPDLVPAIGMGDTSYVCIGNMITFNVASNMDTILWSTGGTNSSITVSNAGTYWVSVVDSGCYDSDTTYLVVQNYPTVSASAASSTTICEGVPVALNATGGVSYQWYLNGSPLAGETGATHMAGLAGNYTVVCYNEGGCSDSTTSPIAITVLPAPTLDIGSDTTICPGDTVVLTAPTFPSHSWCTGGSASSITVTQTGTYCLTVTDGNNCSSTDSILITVNPTPTANFSYVISNQLTVNFTSTSSGASVYQWDFGDGQTSTFQNPVHLYDTLLNFTACLTVIESGGLGCDHTFCDVVWLDPIAIENELPSDMIDVYPNPAVAAVRLRFNLAFEGEVQMALLDALGKQHLSKTWNQVSNGEKELSLSGIAAGTYFLHIDTKAGKLVRKLIIAE